LHFEDRSAFDIRLGRVTVGFLLLLGVDGVGVAGAVVVAGEDVGLLSAEAVPVVCCAGVQLLRLGAKAVCDDAVKREVSGCWGGVQDRRVELTPEPKGRKSRHRSSQQQQMHWSQ
jgi:hypothetical protein